MRNPQTPPLARAGLFATSMVAVLAAAGCNSSPNFLPGIDGGVGSVIPVARDGAVHDGSSHDGAAGGHAGGAAGGAGGGANHGAGGAAAVAGHGGTGTSTGGTGGGATTGTGGSSVGGSTGATGGAGGAVSSDDPCTACEKAKCNHPRGLTTPTEKHSILAGAYEVCFVGTGWPSTVADPAVWCGGPTGDTGANALGGTQRGAPKTQLCQAILKCVHRTNCTGGEATDAQTDCYCGKDVDIQTCEATQFTPTGQCVNEIADGLESTVFSTSSQFFGDYCMANGAAFAIYDFCDSNCCEKECLGVTPAGGEDLSYCNAAVGGSSGTATGGQTGTGGAAHTGGTSGSTGGVSGTGGTVATGGVSGTGGTVATGGVPGTGGTVATGGVSGTGGMVATGGASGTGGSATGGAVGTGGSGTGGLSGIGGAAGTGGMTPPATAVVNGTFDSGTGSWTAGLGVTLVRSTNDAHASATSGSLDVSFVGNSTQNQENGASQCLSATPGASVSVAANILVPGQLGSEGVLALWFYGSTDCSGALNSVFSGPVSVTNGWQAVNGSTHVPAGVGSMAIRLLVYKPAGQTNSEAIFDDVTVTTP